ANVRCCGAVIAGRGFPTPSSQTARGPPHAHAGRLLVPVLTNRPACSPFSRAIVTSARRTLATLWIASSVMPGVVLTAAQTLFIDSCGHGCGHSGASSAVA